MTDFDDDQLISGAFSDFNAAADPAVRPAGSTAIRGLAAQRRKIRITMLSVLGALAIAAPVATYAALAQDNQGPPLPPGSSRSPDPTLAPTPSPTPPGSGSPVVTVTTAYFAVPEQFKSVKIYSYTAGKATLLTTISGDDYGYVANTITVSPDGRNLAWVQSDQALMVSSINGSNKRKVLDNVDTAGKTAPVWTPDSTKLVTSKGTVDVATKTIISTTPVATYQTWSVNGQFYAHLGATNATEARVIVKRADGIQVSDTKVTCDNCESHAQSTLAVSSDGRHVALGGYPTTGEREHSWRKVLDTQTGKELSLSLPAAPNSGRFLDDKFYAIYTGNSVEAKGLDGSTRQIWADLPAELTVSHSGLRYPVLLGAM